MSGSVLAATGRWDSSMTGSSRALGLRNETGQQNCFLNVVIQALWRLQSCRKFFSGIDKETGNFILDALAQLYNEYAFTEEPDLPPDQVRIALASMFASMSRFQLGEMDDAGESLDGILLSIHGGDIDKPCHDRNKCLGHRLFTLSLLKEEHCGIQGHARVSEESNFGFRIYAQELFEYGAGIAHDLASAIREMHSAQNCDIPCQKCRGEMGIRYFLLSQPNVLCLNLVWPSADPGKQLASSILDLVHNSATRFDLKDAIDVFESGEATTLRPYALSGMICFYPGLHYVYFGRKSSKDNSWYLFDDHQVKFVGSSFEAVIEKCLLAKYHPVVLLFETINEVSDQPRSMLREAKLNHEQRVNRQDDGVRTIRVNTFTPLGSSTSPRLNTPLARMESWLPLSSWGDPPPPPADPPPTMAHSFVPPPPVGPPPRYSRDYSRTQQPATDNGSRVPSSRSFSPVQIVESSGISDFVSQVSHKMADTGKAILTQVFGHPVGEPSESSRSVRRSRERSTSPVGQTSTEESVHFDIEGAYDSDEYASKSMSYRIGRTRRRG